MSSSLLHHDSLRFPPPHKYPLPSVSSLTTACFPAGQDMHVHWAIRMWSGTWQTWWAAKCWVHTASSPPGLPCSCMGSLHPTVHDFTTSAAPACWGSRAAHVCSRCSAIPEQSFVNPAHGKSQRTSTTAKWRGRPEGYQPFVQVLVE